MVNIETNLAPTIFFQLPPESGCRMFSRIKCTVNANASESPGAGPARFCFFVPSRTEHSEIRAAARLRDRYGFAGSLGKKRSRNLRDLLGLGSVGSGGGGGNRGAGGRDLQKLQ